MLAVLVGQKRVSESRLSRLESKCVYASLFEVDDEKLVVSACGCGSFSGLINSERASKLTILTCFKSSARDVCTNVLLLPRQSL